jgi:hypothetical protein
VSTTALPTRTDTIQHRFARFHAEHPEVFERLEHMARRWFEQGHDTIGIGMLWEAMRWLDGTADAPELPGFNDHYRSRYARLLIEQHPEWAPRFRTRELRAA